MPKDSNLEGSLTKSDTNELHYGTLQHASIDRRYCFIFPKNYNRKKLCPIVFCFVIHDESQLAQFAPLLRPLADVTDSLLIFPYGESQFWNSDIKVDDPGFVCALIDLFVKNFNGDANRVYLIGTSNGGGIVFGLSFLNPDKITAMAVFVSCLSDSSIKEFADAKPLPIFILNGTADPIVNFAGGPVMLGPIPLPAVVPTTNMVAYWTNRNKVTGQAKVTNYPDINTNDGSTVVRYDYTGAADVVFLKVIGGGHALPTLNGQFKVGVIGVNSDIESLFVAWDFLFQFKREAGNVVKLR
jgi:poly(3-hydroxybutyrate) depolymerase